MSRDLFASGDYKIENDCRHTPRLLLEVVARIGHTRSAAFKAMMQNYAPGQEPESVYNLLPAYQAPVQKAALYRSKVTVLCQALLA